ncbi:Conserved_hypothetical protein [Hexamita inflata]|uniref:Uncharacterized protein n=1 Tax=Hexamita inflata TaxID=28002 RepID=A0AA86UA35_9EUKA|nr:Conserved hypothetical protein [Hexamita inflata]
MLAITFSIQYQVFSISEFEFCYNYVFDTPFQESLNLNMTAPFTFDAPSARSNCTETQNVIFRQISSPVVSLQLDLKVDTQQTSFALFFYVFKNVEIQNSNIKMNLQNGDNKNVSFLTHTSPEFTISLFAVAYNVQTDASSFKNIYGISRVLDQKLTLNQTSFTFLSSSTGIANFFGLCHQADQVQLENSSFNLNVISTIAVGLLYINTGFVQVYNLSMSGQLSGTNTFGMIFNAQAQVNFNLITFSLKTLGATLNCGFVQTVSGSAIVTTSNINFVGFGFSPSEPVSYGAGSTCPCIQGAQLSQGLCNCSIGSSLVSGVCQCTAGATMVGNSCVCTTNALLVGDFCVCQPANSQLQSGVCVCTPTYSTMQGSICVCTPTSSNMNNGVCTCPLYSLISPTACVCQPTGTSMLNNICTCFAGATLNDGQCECNTAGAYPSGNTCVCNPNYYKEGWLPDGNAWCTNVNQCCTKCMAKIGPYNWVCTDWNYHTCTHTGRTVLN